MLELVREGDPAPGAEAVAERASVGLRTVFRHFNEMDALYREMSQIIESRLLEAVSRPLQGETWRERLTDLVDRRSGAFEIISPFRAAADLHRLRSPALQEAHVRLNAFLRAVLMNETPDDELDGEMREGLDLLLSYDAWRRLRADQGLDPDAARAVVKATLARMIQA